MTFTDLRFLHSHHMPHCTARVDKQFVGYQSLQFVESGSVELFYNDARHLVSPGGLWTGFPGPHTRFHAAPGHAQWNHRYAAFAGPRVANWIAGRLWFTEPQQFPVTPQFVARFDDLIGMIQRSDDHFAHARAVNALEGILLELAEHREKRNADIPVPDWLTSLLEAMDGAGFQPADWAKANGMSLATVRRHFKATTGVPLHGSLLQRRLANARALLADTEMPIKAVAETLGYKDVYFFTRQFRQLVGVPPASFRRSRQ